MTVDVPKAAGIDEPFYPQSLERGRRSSRAVMLAIAEMYVQGVSTRDVAKVMAEFGLKSLSSTQVSRAAALLDEELAAWRRRPRRDERAICAIGGCGQSVGHHPARRSTADSSHHALPRNLIVHWRGNMAVLALGVLSVLGALGYLLFWPVPIQPVAWRAPRSKGDVGSHARNARLTDLRLIDFGGSRGPESIAVDAEGRPAGALAEIAATMEARKIKEVAFILTSPTTPDEHECEILDIVKKATVFDAPPSPKRSFPDHAVVYDSGSDISCSPNRITVC